MIRQAVIQLLMIMFLGFYISALMIITMVAMLFLLRWFVS